MINKLRDTLANILPKGSFARNVLTIMTGTVFAQALSILVAPILTRLYSPADYGAAAIYGSIVSILSIIACWRYESTIVLPEKDEDAANLLVLSIIICFGMSTFTLVLVALFRTPFADLLGAPKLASWLWFMPLSLLAAGLFQAFNYWSTRRGHFARLAMRLVAQSSVTAGTQLGAGLISHPGLGGLIAGSIIGQSVATGQLAGKVLGEECSDLRIFLKKSSLKNQFKRYRDFPLYFTWASLLNTSSVMLPVILLGIFFKPAVVGLYALGLNVLSMPMTVIGNATAQVFLPSANKAYLNGKLNEISLKVFERLLNIGLVPILLIMVCAPELFSIIFGHRWLDAGVYVRWLGIWILFVFISSPISDIYTVLERQKASLLMNILQFVCRVAVLMIGGYLGNPNLTIAMFGIISAMLIAFSCFYILWIAGVSVLQVFSSICKYVARALPYLLVPVILKFIGVEPVILVSISISSGIIFLIIRVKYINELFG
jgi:lipopolysaccharide exporter